MNYRWLKILPVIAAIALAVGCSKTSTTGASLDPAFRAGISPDAQAIVSVKLDQVKASELYRTHQQFLKLPQFDSLARRAGLDPRHDVSSLCLVLDGKHVVLLSKGTFSAAQVQEKLIAAGAQREPYKTFTLFVDAGGSAVAFPGEGMAVASSTPFVKAELDLLSSKSGAIPEELQKRLAEIPADSQIWEVSRGGLPTSNLTMRADLDSLLSNFASSVTGTSFGLRFDSGSHLLSRIICKSPEGAQRVNDSFRGLIGLARLSTRDNELDLLRLWDAVSISKDQQFVRVQADLPADLSDKLISKIADLRGQAGELFNKQ